jgi:hypothetical protein
MNHGGHPITAQASAPNLAPTSYTTSRDTIVGLRLDGFGMKEVSEALEGKGKGEFVHLRAQSSRSGE